jgi:anthranilate phosphoribosyltransferase
MLLSGKSRNTHYIMSLLPFLHRVSAREDLSAQDALKAMTCIFDGQSTTPQVAAFLVALRMKGETADELLGFAQAMRARVERVDCGLNGERLVDTCGTGGEGFSTFNISTIAAFVAAGAGARVAKHGNRSLASLCGSADVLEALGVRIQTSPGQMAAAIRETGIGFMFAPALHPAMKHAQPARIELKMRTVFNLLGPLTNPAGADSQLIGAPSEHAAKLMAGALAGLGTEHSFVVYGRDGLDEVSTVGETVAYEIRGSHVDVHVWSPEDFGVPRASIEHLAGGDREANSGIVREVLAGNAGPRRDIVLVNAACALVAADLARDLKDGVQMAADAIDSGRARRSLDALAEFSLHSGTIGAS